MNNGNKTSSSLFGLNRGWKAVLRMAVMVWMMLGGRVWGQTRTEITDATGLNAMVADGNYVITQDITIPADGYTTKATFTGTLTSQAKADGTFPVISGLTQPLFTTATDAIISNVILKNVHISTTGNVGAIACTANGNSRIYNCGILPTTPKHATAGRSTVGSSNSKYCGSLVGYLNENARVINCFSYADVVMGGGSVGGLVGNNAQTSDQNSIKTIVVNCIFYGDINTTFCSSYSPVFGNKDINNSTDTGINPYCFFSAKDGTFANADFTSYKRSWPVAEEYLTRFEYYRSIFNSNRRLCTFWITDKQYGSETNAPTTEDEALMAKWVLDESIAPYPILKKWGKYPSIINPDTVKVWDTATSAWVQRTNAKAYQGKIVSDLGCLDQPGKLKVIVKAGSNNSTASNKTLYLPITDMDTLHYDYCYAKVQLPYYNEQFGNPNGTTHAEIYGKNYTDKVVTGWKVIDVKTKDGYVDTVCFEGPWDGDGRIRYRKNSKAWESGFNFADRKCTSKDLYVTSGRVFAQGGYYYVPEGVTEITIEAYWGKAVYLHNKGHYIDRVNITNKSGNRTVGDPFSPAGTLSNSFQGQTVWDEWHTAVKKLDVATETDGKLNKSVYDQAIVLLSNYQIRNENGAVGYDIDSEWRPYTIMSIDQDIDNEPDYCFEFQFRKEFQRPPIQPIRFDFLPVPELGMAVRHGVQMNTIGIFIPQGHFEITETSFMHTTQFEYDFDGTKIEAPVILNGGHFEQIVVRKGDNKRTSYFIMGGHFRMLRFTPGRHCNSDNNGKKTRHCAVNAIGGEYPEFYLSGIYNVKAGTDPDNPHCYTNGGRFDMIAGAGYEKIDGNITFKIDHSLIREFYGGGINGSKPVTGSIDVTIDNSLVYKYCGGPKVGLMNNGKTVTTKATGTTFTKFYGGGNGGTSYYRQQKQDGNVALPAATAAGWANYGYKIFNPLNTVSGVDPAYEGPGTNSENKGYHALFEFECFVESNGIGGKPTIRSYLHWAQFGSTATGNISNELNNCIVEKDFFGGGNLGNVNGNVVSTLNNCEIKGNVFGGGYSGKIEPFRIHDKSTAKFPYIDNAGVMQNGMNRTESCDYIKNDDGTYRYYTWSNASGHVTTSPTFLGDDGQWYVYTTVSLEGLGAVSNDVELNLIGTTKVGTEGDPNTGNVFGGGNESTVNGSATITISGSAEVLQNVFGGGNQASVGVNTTGTPGNTTVKLQEGAKVIGNVYGGGNNGPVGGDSEVIIQDAPTISGETPFTTTTTVTITGPAGSEIHYTTDGTPPTELSPTPPDTLPLSETTTVKAIAITNGVASPVATKTFTKL